MILARHSARLFRTERGFTLIEVIVALTIMGLLVSIAFSGVRISLDGWDRGARKIAALEQRATVERLLRRQLSLAYSMESIAGRPPIPFRGSATRVEFVSDYS